jgi:hypothetical protein
MDPADNPFSSRFIRPGAIPYRFRENDSSLAALYERWKQCSHVAQIRGDHGSGKSTLLASLARHFETDGFQLRTHVMAEVPRDVRTLLADQGWTPRTVVVVDGYERLSWWSRCQLRFKRWAAGAKILLTTHVDLGFPNVCTLRPTADDVIDLVRYLQRDRQFLVTDDDARAAFTRHPSNVREALFELFDVYERRIRETASSAKGAPQ